MQIERDLTRSDLRNGGSLMAKSLADNAELKAKVRAILEPYHAEYCARLIEGVKRGERTAMHLYPKLVGLVGAESDVIAQVLVQLGVASLEAARRLMELAQEAQIEDPADLYERSLRYVQGYRQRNGMPLLVEGEPRAVVLEEGQE